jgi:uncharacterized protein (DUF1778 family)
MPHKSYRNESLHTTVTRAEKELVRCAAKAAGLSVAEWVRIQCVEAAEWHAEQSQVEVLTRAP